MCGGEQFVLLTKKINIFKWKILKSNQKWHKNKTDNLKKNTWKTWYYKQFFSSRKKKKNQVTFIFKLLFKNGWQWTTFQQSVALVELSAFKFW